MKYTWQFRIIWDYKDELIQGAMITLELSIISILLAVILGLVWGTARHSHRRLFYVPSTLIVEFFRDTPILIQMFWFFYCIPALTGMRITAQVTAITALSLYYSVYLGEIFRAGIESIDKGLVEAGKVLGMSHFQVLKRIVLPIAIRRMIPPCMNEFTSLIKSSAAASFLAVPELLHVSNNINLTIYRPMEVFTVCALIYFILIYPLAVLSRKIEGWLKI
jgi:polar amino acid transport system permease protein